MSAQSASCVTNPGDGCRFQTQSSAVLLQPLAACLECRAGKTKQRKKLKSCFLCSLFFAGAVLIDQYCNPLSDICLKSVQAQVDDITDKVRKVLRTKNPRHPSLASKAGTVQKCAVLQSLPAPLHISNSCGIVAA